jgi:hypothetical protein
MAFGIIEYNEEGLPKCEICGLFFNRVIPHARHKHSLTEKEYKKQFGLDIKKGVCSKESSAKTREKTLQNYDKCIKNNLEIKGEKSRFTPGATGRTKQQVSAQSKIRLKQRLKEPYMVAAMKLNGEKVGKSGLGNKTRWNKK